MEITLAATISIDSFVTFGRVKNIFDNSDKEPGMLIY